MSTKQKFEDTSFYKNGKFFEELGKMMQEPNTTMEDLSDFLLLHNREFFFHIRPAPED